MRMVEECETLERWVWRRKSAQALTQRSRIVLKCAGQANTVVARKLGLTHETVGKWRQRFVDQPHLAGICVATAPGGGLQAL
jgi:DNA-binding NarL/FixJ family response regulator